MVRLSRANSESGELPGNSGAMSQPGGHNACFRPDQYIVMPDGPSIRHRRNAALTSANPPQPSYLTGSEAHTAHFSPVAAE
jgi:hypothetical protein